MLSFLYDSFFAEVMFFFNLTSLKSKSLVSIKKYEVKKTGSFFLEKSFGKKYTKIKENQLVKKSRSQESPLTTILQNKSLISHFCFSFYFTGTSSQMSYVLQPWKWYCLLWLL